MRRSDTIVGKVIRLIGLIGLIGLMGACSSKQEPVEPEEPQEEMPIGFRATVESESNSRGGTRAETLPGDGELTTPLLKELGFGVYCWYTGSKNVIFTDDKGTTPQLHISNYAQYMLMRNQKVEWKNASWTYDPPKYWPVDPTEKLTLRAYAPYTSYLTADDKGMPLLPVVVKADDYHNGTQHDPVWGTGKLVQTTGAEEGEYYPDNPEPPEEPVYPDNKKYGSHYNNITYKMSGDWRDNPNDHDPADTRNGTIDWYFHHGMAKLVFWGLLDDKSLQPTAKITSIKLTPLYNQGLLNISSPTGSDTEKPIWPIEERSGEMEVELLGWDTTNETEQDLQHSQIGKIDNTEPNDGWTLLTEKGLLIIPRDYSQTPMKLTVTIYNQATSSNVTMSTDITQNFLGNTIYSLRMTVSNVLYVEIDLVKSAFTPWTETSTDHKIYNW